MWARILICWMLLALVAACAPTASPPTTTTAPTVGPTPQPNAVQSIWPAAAPTSTALPVLQAGELLYLRDDYNVGGPGQVTVVDTAAGRPIRQLPLGVPATDWSALYTAQSSDGKTTLRAIDPTTAGVIHQTTIDGVYDVAGASPNGSWLVLQWHLSQAETRAFDGNGHWRSRYLILDRALAAPGKTISLDGKFSFDAIDSRGAALFLIENLSPRASGGPPPYQVRLYDLTTSALQPGVIADKTASELMAGNRWASVYSPDGKWLYSLYANEVKGPFIHALNLADRYAVCLDLPAAGKEDFGKQLLWSLAMSRDGQALYAANGALGIVAALDLVNLSVARTAQLPLAAQARASSVAGLTSWLVSTAEAKRVLLGGAVLTPDGRTLFVIGEKGLLAIDTSNLALRGRYLTDWTLDSLALGPDGARLYVVDAERALVVALNPGTGETLATVRGVDHPWAVLRVAPISDQ